MLGENRPSVTRARILVVDDEDVVRAGLTRLLEANEYECASAADAEAARELLGSQPFDVILCDIQMPGPSGLELLQQIAAELIDTAIVRVTGVDDPEVAGRALHLGGAHGYVVNIQAQ